MKTKVSRILDKFSLSSKFSEWKKNRLDSGDINFFVEPKVNRVARVGGIGTVPWHPSYDYALEYNDSVLNLEMSTTNKVITLSHDCWCAIMKVADYNLLHTDPNSYNLSRDKLEKTHFIDPNSTYVSDKDNINELMDLINDEVFTKLNSVELI